MMSVIFLTLTIFATYVGGECPSSWLRFDDSCYHFSHDTKSWMSAQQACQVLYGANLATITNVREDSFLLGEILKYNAYDWWIGGHDMSAKHVFEWITGEPMTYTNWMAYEPNDSSGTEDCIELRIEPESGGRQPGWNDNTCDKPFHYICERPRSGVIVG